MSDVVYSIIIPHRNIPDLLKRCLTSIPRRDDIEVIVVDDNSDSSIVDFESFPGLQSSNVHVIFDKSGKGAGHARNIGIEKAKGKWLLFVDADDFFNYCISDVLDKYRGSSYDIIFFNANSLDTESYMPCQRAKHLNGFINLWGTNRAKSEKQLRYVFGEPWGKIVSRQMVVDHAIRFDETPIHNDTKFSYLIGYYARTISVESNCAYCITVRQGSTSVSKNITKEFTRVEVFSRAERFFRERGIDVSVPRHYWQVAVFFLRDIKLGRRGFETLRKENLPLLKCVTYVTYFFCKETLKTIVDALFK